MDQQRQPDPASTQQLALSRTLMAAERTLMAWVRTSLSLMTFGFSIAKFFQYLNEQLGPTIRVHLRSPRLFGLTLILLGLGSLIIAVIEHRSFIKQLHRVEPAISVRLSTATVTAAILFGVGILMLINILYRIL